jgi:hypothetical protein
VRRLLGVNARVDGRVVRLHPSDVTMVYGPALDLPALADSRTRGDDVTNDTTQDPAARVEVLGLVRSGRYLLVRDDGRTRLVRFAAELAERVAAEGSEPVVVVGLTPCGDGTYDMTLRTPDRHVAVADLLSDEAIAAAAGAIAERQRRPVAPEQRALARLALDAALREAVAARL